MNKNKIPQPEQTADRAKFHKSLAVLLPSDSTVLTEELIDVWEASVPSNVVSLLRTAIKLKTLRFNKLGFN